MLLIVKDLNLGNVQIAGFLWAFWKHVSMKIQHRRMATITRRQEWDSVPRKLSSLPPLSIGLAVTLGLCSQLCGQSVAIAQNVAQSTGLPTTPSNLAPGRIETLPPVMPLPSDVLPTQPSNGEQLPSPQLPSTDPLSNEDLTAKVRVDRIDVVGSTVFKPEQFATVTAPFVGREITFAELLQARDAITKLYTDSGYVTTGAIVTPQTLKDGVVTIEVLEGKLEEIKVTGNRRLKTRYIRDRIQLGAKQPLKTDHLLESLQMLRLDPRIQGVSADLQTGVRPGSNILQVDVQEAKTFFATFSLDNGRSPSVGSFRRKVEFQEANLLGWGDTITFGYTNTNGSNAIDLSYLLPVNPRNGTVSFSYGTSWNRVIEDPFSVLDIQSKSRYYDLSFRQPLLQKPTKEFAVGFSFSRQESQTELGLDNIGPFPLSPGADSEGKTKVSALRFFQEYTQRSNRHVFALRSQFSVGVDWFGATTNEGQPDSRFTSWRGQAQWVRQLAPDSLFLLKGDLQLTNNSLLPLEQMGLGGQVTVRGYRQDALLTDSGALVSAELRLPIVRSTKSGTLIQLAPFLDIGTGWNSKQDNPDPETLIGAGLGLIWKQGNNLSVRLDWGIPLVSVEGEKRSLQENGLYFSVNYTPF
ncbi:ShlB/FhaC/HecB family hemolysin secretion/activation protein [Alkalinema pantanalense CENA528]|uniref:ShlB/FhaC/HecB family hemolysin secretion/activation protein n=1 Tax=Alkalinema pantanalense TaxID=1620705 RepID=UPI003D6E14D3